MTSSFTDALVIVLSTLVGGICRILRYPLIWKASNLWSSDWLSWIVSNPDKSLLRRIEWKTWIFHEMEFCALVQNSLSLLQVRIESAMRFITSCSLSTLSVRRVPRYVAVCLRGTRDPSANLIEDCFQIYLYIYMWIYTYMQPHTDTPPTVFNLCFYIVFNFEKQLAVTLWTLHWIFEGGIVAARPVTFKAVNRLSTAFTARSWPSLVVA